MPDQIYIGNFARGFKTNPLPFNIDNDAFPTMVNIYSWRGRAKRKRGTIFLGQLQVQVQSVNTSTPPESFQFGTIATLDGSGNQTVDLLTFISAGSGASIAPGTIHLTDGTNTFTEPASPDGTIVGSPSGSGTINYATGLLTINGGVPGAPLVGSAGVTSFGVFPGLPVMGLRDFVSTSSSSLYPLLLAFDTQKSYQINQNSVPVFFYNVNYYKINGAPFSWNGGDFQQFWTTNYQNALWATNNVPGMQFLTITTITTGAVTTISTAPTNHNLQTGDFVFFNEIGGADAGLLNGQAFPVTTTGLTSFTVAVNTAGKSITSPPGIFQLLTKSINGSVDGIRWYDGDPTNGTGIPTGSGLGWVNFAPPLSATQVTIDNFTSPPGKPWYLVGCLAILPFKDRLLFFSPYIGSSDGTIIQLQDVVIWSWNGTPYYSLPVPSTPTGTETVDVTAYYVDQTGHGGWLAAGYQQPILTVNNNEDVLLVGFSQKQTRFVYSGDDLNPFLFFTINSELGSSATFSGVTMDRGGLTIGRRGIVITTQQSSERIDLDIPNEIFDVQAANNGPARVNAVRDFFREWIYFTYPVGTGTVGSNTWTFPTRTLLYNYRDVTWAILYENFTAQGTYRKATKYTWATIPFPTWSQWNERWNSASTTTLFPSIVAGNPQGYVLIKGEGTGEALSGTISAISNNGGFLQIGSFNHCVDADNPLTGDGDFLFVQGAIGTPAINNVIGKVTNVIDSNNFVTDIPFPSGTYSGGGKFARLSQPLLQTKQFPFYWNEGRKVVLKAQKYLLDNTAAGQITANIYLSQDADNAWNTPDNNAVVYSQIVFTSPELPVTNINTQNLGTIGDGIQTTFTFSIAQNLVAGSVMVIVGNVATFTDNGSGGFTATGTGTSVGSSVNYMTGAIVLVFTIAPAGQQFLFNYSYNTSNIQNPVSPEQFQIWHRYNTSLVGDTFQIGITLSDSQMRSLYLATAEIALHGMHLTVDKGPHLS